MLIYPTADGPWHPPLSRKQLEVYNETRRYILSSGPRWCTKTTASLHKILRHLWDVDPARLAIFTKYKSTSLAGVWPKLCGGRNAAIQHWLDAELESEYGGEFRYEIKPREMGAIRMHYFKVINQFGGVSECQLYSLDYDKDVEEKMFSTEFTAFYFAELQHFSDPNVFYVTDDQLRMDGVKFEQYMWLADTNPPLGDATDHFAYKIWFEQRSAKPPSEASDIEKEEFEIFRQQLALHEFTMDDAEGIVDPRQLAKIKAKYRNDPEAWDRFVLGKWTKGIGRHGKHFAGLFRKHVHVLGSVEASDESEWQLLNPHPDAYELFGGWDLGKVNHAHVMAQKSLNDDGKTVWDVVDELVVIAEKVRIEDFTKEAMDKRAKLEKHIGHPVLWRDWTDTSAFDWSKGGTDELDFQIVQRVSFGKIIFMPATDAKRPGSVRKRVELIRRLLSENRIRVSAHCRYLIEMFEELRKGANEVTFVARGQEQKHIFDAFSYLIYMESLEDLEEEIVTEGVTGPRLLSIA